MSGTTGATLAYRYSAPSRLLRDELRLATSGGITEAGPAAHPYFFTGFLAEPAPAAQALLATAAIARAQYHVAASTIQLLLRDPVVTSNADRLRFESFSGCCGVHARLDLPPEALAAMPAASGCTNVDFNPPMRAALAGAVATASQLLLKVGDEEVTAVTERASVTERKVELPSRWIKGFGEVSALHAWMRPVAELTGADATRFIAGLPRAARGPLWAVPAGRSLSLTATLKPGGACLAGPERLAELRPLLRFTKRLRVYAPPSADGDFGAGAAGHAALPAPSAWELTLGGTGARFTLTLSPEKYRGFSGEGALLGAFAVADATAEDAGLIGLLLGWDPVIDPASLAASAGLSAERVAAALAVLASSGAVGYDLACGAYFHRELPLGAEVERVHPRLADARELVAAGQVTLTEGGAMSGDHRVSFADGVDTCTCPWWGKHRGTRGPCKHVLAARIALGAGPGDPRITGQVATGEAR
ncbi:MAG TPA: SWIM zinc finger family protein [Trebonia sp.]|nr:SWIM zinc finger family protein [Trebonia sp.]